jgi:hypothetical protein
MRTSIVFVVLALMVGSAYAADQTSGVVNEIKSPYQLPADFDYASGYSEYEIGDGVYEAYIAQPMYPEAMGYKEVFANAFREGWFWDGVGNAACQYETPPEESPELRINRIDTHDQRAFFCYKVPRAASRFRILVAVLVAYSCDSYSALPLDVECWDAYVEGGGPGDSYSQSCGGSDPYSNPTMPMPSWNLISYQSTKTVIADQQFYIWKCTDAVQTWADNAPTTGCLVIFGAGGTGYFKRLSSSCNYAHPDTRPFLYVRFVRK